MMSIRKYIINSIYLGAEQHQPVKHFRIETLIVPTIGSKDILVGILRQKSQAAVLNNLMVVGNGPHQFITLLRRVRFLIMRVSIKDIGPPVFIHLEPIKIVFVTTDIAGFV